MATHALHSSKIHSFNTTCNSTENDYTRQWLYSNPGVPRDHPWAAPPYDATHSMPPMAPPNYTWMPFAARAQVETPIPSRAGPLPGCAAAQGTAEALWGYRGGTGAAGAGEGEFCGTPAVYPSPEPFWYAPQSLGQVHQTVPRGRSVAPLLQEVGAGAAAAPFLLGHIHRPAGRTADVAHASLAEYQPGACTAGSSPGCACSTCGSHSLPFELGKIHTPVLKNKNGMPLHVACPGYSTRAPGFAGPGPVEVPSSGGATWSAVPEEPRGLQAGGTDSHVGNVQPPPVPRSRGVLGRFLARIMPSLPESQQLQAQQGQDLQQGQQAQKGQQGLEGQQGQEVQQQLQRPREGGQVGGRPSEQALGGAHQQGIEWKGQGGQGQQVQGEEGGSTEEGDEAEEEGVEADEGEEVVFLPSSGGAPLVLGKVHTPVVRAPLAPPPLSLHLGHRECPFPPQAEISITQAAHTTGARYGGQNPCWGNEGALATSLDRAGGASLGLAPIAERPRVVPGRMSRACAVTFSSTTEQKCSMYGASGPLSHSLMHGTIHEGVEGPEGDAMSADGLPQEYLLQEYAVMQGLERLGTESVEFTVFQGGGEWKGAKGPQMHATEQWVPGQLGGNFCGAVGVCSWEEGGGGEEGKEVCGSEASGMDEASALIGSSEGLTRGSSTTTSKRRLFKGVPKGPPPIQRTNSNSSFESFRSQGSSSLMKKSVSDLCKALVAGSSTWRRFKPRAPEDVSVCISKGGVTLT